MPRLITIPISHFCEIARWSLDHAGVAYKEEPHLQVLHAAAVRRVGGHRKTPVLVTESGLVEGSVEILEWADQHRDPKRQSVRVSRAEMGELFGVPLDHYGAATRRLFYVNVGECSTKFSMRINAQGAPRWERRVFRATGVIGPGSTSSSAIIDSALESPALTISTPSRNQRSSSPSSSSSDPAAPVSTLTTMRVESAPV